MKIKLYSAHWSSLGGGEKYLCSLAEALSEKHKVMLILDGPGRIEIEERMGHRLDNVATCYGDARDASIVLSNVFPWGKGLCRIVQIPYRPITIGSIGRSLVLGHLREAGKDVLRKKMLGDARKSEIALCYSKFVRNELMRNHGIDAEVLYPPVSDMASDIPKKKVILSVGRFFGKNYNVKRYDALIEAFKQFSALKPDWEYRIVGGLGESEAEEEYLLSLQLQAQGYPITFFINVPHEDLRKHYGEATLYWHAAGYGAKSPEDCESFGISVVEAMSAGCVPIVHASGGPEEILFGSESGYHWRSPLNLAVLSEALAEDGCGWLAINSRNAIKRAKDFTYAKFKEKALEIFSHLEGK